MGGKFSQRSNELEIMDDLSCSGETVNQTLIELDHINKWLGGNKVTIQALNDLLRHRKKTDVIHIADLGCGSGEMLKLIRKWANKNKRPIALTGVDANPNIIAFAQSHLQGVDNIRLLAIDILSKDFKNQKYDIVIGTLFYHHFSTSQLIDFFKQIKKQVTVGLIINDIHRHWLAYESIRLITKYFSRSGMVKYDAPLSVLRAFSRSDLVEILTKAGVESFTIKWRWAFRWQVIVKV